MGIGSSLNFNSSEKDACYTAFDKTKEYLKSASNQVKFDIPDRFTKKEELNKVKKRIQNINVDSVKKSVAKFVRKMEEAEERNKLLAQELMNNRSTGQPIDWNSVDPTVINEYLNLKDAQQAFRDTFKDDPEAKEKERNQLLAQEIENALSTGQKIKWPDNMTQEEKKAVMQEYYDMKMKQYASNYGAKEYYTNAVTYAKKSPAINDYYVAEEQIEEWRRNGLRGDDLENAKKLIHYDEKKKKYNEAVKYYQKQSSNVHEKMLKDTSINDIENHSNIKRDDEVFKETAARRVEASKTARSIVAFTLGPAGLAANGAIDAYGKGAEQMEKGRGKEKGASNFDTKYRQAQATTAKELLKTGAEVTGIKIVKYNGPNKIVEKAASFADSAVKDGGVTFATDRMAGKSNAETAKNVWNDVVDAGKDEIWNTGWDKGNEYLDNVGESKEFNEKYAKFEENTRNKNYHNPTSKSTYKDPLQDILKKPGKKAYEKSNLLK